MSDNLLLGPDAPVTHTIDMLRSLPVRGAIEDGAQISAGAFIAVDPKGRVTGSYSTGSGSVIRMNYQVAQPVRWVTLNLPLGGVDFTSRTIFGVVCKSRAQQATTFRLCLRSATPDGFVDTFLDKHVVAFAQSSTHIDLVQLVKRDVPLQAEWRQFLLFFPLTDADLEIEDLRVFIV